MPRRGGRMKKEYGISGFIKSKDLVVNFFFRSNYYQFRSNKLPFLPKTCLHFRLTKNMLCPTFMNFDITLYKEKPRYKSLGIHTCKIIR